MSIPGQTFRILDPGLAAAPAAINTPLYMGCCEKGTPYTVYSFSRISDVIATLGQGPLSEAVCTHLGTPNAGGPVLAVKLAGTVAALLPQTPTVGATAGTGPTGATITLSGVPFDSYSVQVVITKAATFDIVTPFAQLTPAEFAYSLDGGYTFTQPYTIPTGGVFIVPGTGAPGSELTFTFAGTTVPVDNNPLHWPNTNWSVGNMKAGLCTAPHYTASELAAGITAVIAASVEFAFLVLTGEAATSSLGAGLAVAAGAQAGTLQNRFQFVGVITAAGRSIEATAIGDYAMVGDTRVLATFGRCDVLSRKPFNGWAYPNRSIVDVVAARAGASLISTDLGRVASGPLPGVVAIYHDESLNEVLDQKRFTTVRTIQGRTGFYITQGKMMSPLGSDYRLWQHRRCMDVACDTTYKAQLPFLNESTRTNGDGTIDERDAARFEGPVNTALQANLMDPNSAAGTPGHVSAFGYHIDRTNNLLGTETLKTSVAIRPRGYLKNIVTELGFTANVGG